MFLENDLRERWRDLCIAFTTDTELIDKRWNELKDAYASKKRYYHNLDHLLNMFREFDGAFHLLDDHFKAFQAAIYYHDIIYNVKRKDNEEQSAELAVAQLSEMNFPQDIITKTVEYIIATKLHEKNAADDVNLFIDIDMAILGYDWEIYETYARQVRKEYSVYPTILYKKGRREVLQQFLDAGDIFKTTMFKNKYEAQARSNIQREIEMWK